MELKFDTSKTYAIALEGGGARGAYQIGVWEAFRESGIKYNAVSGSSVGALNGAMMALKDFDEAKSMWANIRFSQVMNVNDDNMEKIFSSSFTTYDLKPIFRKLREIIKDRGFDVSPLKKMIADNVDPERLKSSDVEFFFVTYSLTDKKEIEFDAKSLKSDELHNMLLASAYFPAFKHERFNGKLYTDGGVSNVLPIDSLIKRGYKDIIAIKIHGTGIEKSIKIPKDVNLTTIVPTKKLGHVLNFSSKQSNHLLKLGYFDAKRLLFGLYGKSYYIDRTLSEAEAYKILYDNVMAFAHSKDVQPSMRDMHEKLMPRLARELKCSGDYYDMLICALELSANTLKTEKFKIYTDEELLSEIKSKVPLKNRESGFLSITSVLNYIDPRSKAIHDEHFAVIS